MQLIIFIPLLIAGFLTTPNTVLFYDLPEYLNIISTHTFWQVFTLGHFPIHPVFLGILWIATKFIPANFSALIFGIISVFIFYKIAKIIFNKGPFWLSALIFSLLPGVWLLNTNLLVESLALTLYLLAIYLFLRKAKKLFFLAIILLIGTHLESIVWIPTIFLLPIIFKKELKFRREDYLQFIKISLISAFLAGLFYVIVYLFIREGSGEFNIQVNYFTSFGILRMIRNIWFSFINNFGSLTPFLIGLLIIKNAKSKSEWIAWLIFIAAISLPGSYWEGGLMMRRIIFAGVIISLALYKYLGKKAVFLILFLLPITGFNAALYYKYQPSMPLASMQKRIDKLPISQVLVQSHYYYPFTRYEGSVLWLESDDLSQIKTYLEKGTRIFLTKESVTAPYLLVVGNNYHITSLTKTGNSEARKLFETYKVESYNGSFELKLPGTKVISENAGSPVIFYESSLDRLSRMRINYGDIGVWIYSLVSGHKDAIGWTYKDATGAWVWP